MNVRVLVTLTACFSVTGCCMPAFLCNPALMHCPPTGAYGPQMMNPQASGPPTYRSFHNNFTTTRYQQVPPAGRFASVSPAPIQPVRSVLRQRVAVVQTGCNQCPPQQFVAAAPVLYTPSYQVAQHQPQPPVKPWRFPWKSRTTVKDTSVNQSNYQWLPVVNNGCTAGAPCGQLGCSSCTSTPYFSADGCGESVTNYTMMPTTDLQLNPVPAAPKSAQGRDFSAPAPKRLKPPEIRSDDEDLQERRKTAPRAEPIPSPPPAILKPAVTPNFPEMSEPVPMDSGASPASKPDMADPINPFEDIEDFEPEGSLPVEADMPQAALRIPTNKFQPLIIPSPALPSLASYASRSASDSAVQQTSHQASEWESLSLERGFFQEDAAAHGTHRAMVEAAQQFVPVRRVITRRRQ